MNIYTKLLNSIVKLIVTYRPYPWGPREVLGISSDGDDRRIFLGLKFSILGILGYENLASTVKTRV